MRRFFTTSFIALALVISAAPTAHALGEEFNTPQVNAQAAAIDAAATGKTADTVGAAVSAAAAKTVTGGLPPDPSGSEGFGKIMTWIMSLFAWLVGVAALTLNYAVYYTVVTMGDYVNKLSAIGVTWRILRDIANIMFIFGFIGAGIATILNVDQYGWKTKMLPMLLIGAIFLNFSLFITEAMIDGTNLFATQFYTQIVGGTLPTQAPSGLLTTASGDTLTTANEGISNKIMAQLGLQTMYTAARTNDKVFAAGNTWIIGFMGIILFIITAFVMFSLAFILIARFVALIFFIILCPVAFMGLAIPQMQYRAGQWWKKFLEQIITAPVLLLLLYVALAVITDASFLTGFGAAKDPNAWFGFLKTTGFDNLPGFASMVLSFLVAMGLLLVVVIKAKSMSAFGAAGAIKLGGKLSFGATAFGLRTTAGLGSQLASQAIRRSSWGGTKRGRLLATAFDKGAKSSFDIRGATFAGGLKGIGVDAGEAQKGGYRARKEGSIKGHEEYIKSITTAIDERGIRGDEEKAIAAAETAQENAEAVFKRAKEQYDIAKEQFEPQIAAQQAEIGRLELQKEQEEAAHPNMLADPATDRALVAARQQLIAVRANLNPAKAAHDNAFNIADKARKATDAASKVASDRIKGEKKKAQFTYAENIQGPFFGNSIPGWVEFGPGGAIAAKKIIKEARKDQAAMDRDRLRKIFETADKGDGAAVAPAAAAPGAQPGGHA